MHRQAIAVCVALLGALAVATAQATVVQYPNFNDTSGLTLIGNTGTTGSPAVLRLTQASGSQHGAAYSTTPITLGTSATFSTQFQFRFTDTGGIDPADGITFVLAASPTGLGGSGGGIGYLGVPNSFAVEFDTYNNGSGDSNSSNHVAADSNGVLGTTALSYVYGNQTCDFSAPTSHARAGCMSNGDTWTALITYDGTTQFLNVTLTDPAEGAAFHAIQDFSIDIASLLGTNTAYVGFTSATGAGVENHDILNWIFSNTATLPPTTGVPEPNGLVLFGLGLLGLVGLREISRRRRRAG